MLQKKREKRTINLNWRYRKENTHTHTHTHIEYSQFCEGKIWTKWGKMISNLYKIKWVKEVANYKKEEGSITVK